MSRQALPDPDTRWTDLYRVTTIDTVAMILITLSAVIAYFIWPYAPGVDSTASVFAAIQDNLIGGLVALDVLMLLGMLAQIPLILGLYVALRPISEGYALLALALGLIAVVAVIPSRPIMEMAWLSDQYAATADEAMRSRYLAAGDGLLTLFTGTAWATAMFLLPLSFIISSVLKLRSPHFGRATAIMGIVTSATGLGFVIPYVGALLLFVLTVAGIVWLGMLTRDFARLGWPRRSAEVMPTDSAQPAT